jgi:hypothetical protein
MTASAAAAANMQWNVGRQFEILEISFGSSEIPLEIIAIVSAVWIDCK